MGDRISIINIPISTIIDMMEQINAHLTIPKQIIGSKAIH